MIVPNTHTLTNSVNVIVCHKACAHLTHSCVLPSQGRTAEDLEGTVGAGDNPDAVFGAERHEEWDGGEGDGREFTLSASTGVEEMGAGVNQDVPVGGAENTVEGFTVCVCVCAGACACARARVCMCVHFDTLTACKCSKGAQLSFLSLQGSGSVSPLVAKVPLSPPWLKSPSPLATYPPAQAQLNGQEAVVRSSVVLPASGAAHLWRFCPVLCKMSQSWLLSSN